MTAEPGGIAREHCAMLSVAQFHSRYMLPNVPVLIDISKLTAEWRMLTDWVRRSSGDTRELNVPHLRQGFGEAEVTAHDCGAARVMGSLPSSEMQLGDYLDWWEQHQREESDSATAAGGGSSSSTSSSTSSSGEPTESAEQPRKKKLYLKVAMDAKVILTPPCIFHQ
jgi:hypothetical protein